MISRPNVLARDTQVAAIEISKEHPIVEPRFDRGVSRRDAKAVQQFYDSAHRFHHRLTDYGITANPLLGDLPVVGYLFRNMSRRNSVVNEELMIFLGPEIIKQPQ